MTTTNRDTKQPQKIIVQQQPAVTQTETVTSPPITDNNWSTDTVSSLTPTYCSNGVYVGANVSCAFAENVFDDTYSVWKDNGHVFPSNLYAVHSPATGQNHDLSLVSSSASYALYEDNNRGYVTIGDHTLAVY